MRIGILMVLLLFQFSSSYVIKYDKHGFLKRTLNTNRNTQKGTPTVGYQLTDSEILQSYLNTTTILETQVSSSPGLDSAVYVDKTKNEESTSSDRLRLDEKPLTVFTEDEDIFFEVQSTGEIDTDYDYRSSDNYYLTTTDIEEDNPTSTQENTFTSDEILQGLGNALTERDPISPDLTTIDSLTTSIKEETVTATTEAIQYNTGPTSSAIKNKPNTEIISIEKPPTSTRLSSTESYLFETATEVKTSSHKGVCDYSGGSGKDKCSMNIDISGLNRSQDQTKSSNDTNILALAQSSGNGETFGDSETSEESGFTEDPEGSGDFNSSGDILDETHYFGESRGSGFRESSGATDHFNESFEHRINSGDTGDYIGIENIGYGVKIYPRSEILHSKTVTIGQFVSLVSSNFSGLEASGFSNLSDILSEDSSEDNDVFFEVNSLPQDNKKYSSEHSTDTDYLNGFITPQTPEDSRNHDRNINDIKSKYIDNTKLSTTELSVTTESFPYTYTSEGYLTPRNIEGLEYIDRPEILTFFKYNYSSSNLENINDTDYLYGTEKTLTTTSAKIFKITVSSTQFETSRETASSGSTAAGTFEDQEIDKDEEYSGDVEYSGNAEYSNHVEYSGNAEKSGIAEYSRSAKYSGNLENSGDEEYSGDKEYSGEGEYSKNIGLSGSTEYSGDSEYSGNEEYSGYEEYSGNTEDEIYQVAVHLSKYKVSGKSEIVGIWLNDSDLYFSQ